MNRRPSRPNPKLPLIDVEAEFDKCVSAAGGQRVSEIVGKSPNFNNADYIFSESCVVAELKCLEENQGRNESLKEKIHGLYNQYLKNGKTDLIVYGEVEIDTHQVSEKFAREVLELYRRPIQGVIKKANKQLRQTKEHLMLDDYFGLLLLVNDGHEFLSPDQVKWVLSNTLSRGGYSSINGVIFFTVNMTARHPDYEDDLLVWATMDRPKSTKLPDSFLDELKSAWFKHFQSLVGDVPVREYKIDDVSTIVGMENNRFE